MAAFRQVSAKMLRYAGATIGPVGTAVSQFILSLQLLHTLEPAAFGSFSFLLVTSQFSTGVWSALFCAPLPVLLSDKSQGGPEAMLRCLFVTNIVVAALAFVIFCLLGIMLGVPLTAVLLFAGFGAITLLRWFARAYAYVTGAPLRTMASDLTYSILLAGNIGLFLHFGTTSLGSAYAALLVSATAALLPFGPKYLLRQFVLLSPRDLPRYGAVWRQHSSWSLTGVVTTEATANAHAYIVTLLAGPMAFAPLAASALIIRPISVVMNALTEFERPQMARQIDQGRIAATVHAIRTFRLVMVATWLGTAAAAAALIVYAPHVIFPAKYSLQSLTAGAVIWMLVAGMRLARAPESVLLQAAGVFRWLAYASIVSSGVSIIAVTALLLAGGPLWSVVGVLIGEVVFAFAIWRQARRWRAVAAASPIVTAQRTGTGGSSVVALSSDGAPA